MLMNVTVVPNSTEKISCVLLKENDIQFLKGGICRRKLHCS